MSKASDDVLAERQRQITVEGYTPEHDNEHDSFELVRAGLAYGLIALSHPHDDGTRSLGLNSGGVDIDWRKHARLLFPWDAFKPKSMRRDLVRSAALLIAAIDRIDAEAGPAERERA